MSSSQHGNFVNGIQPIGSYTKLAQLVANGNAASGLYYAEQSGGAIYLVKSNVITVSQAGTFADQAAFTSAGGASAYGSGPVWIAGQQYYCDGYSLYPLKNADIPSQSVSDINYGTLLVDISTVATSAATLATVSTTGVINSVGGKGLNLSSVGTGTASIDLTVSLPLSYSDRSIGFWAYKPATEPASTLNIYLTPDNFTNYILTTVVVRPGLRFYNLNLPTTGKIGIWNPNSTLGASFPGTITKIRVKDAKQSGVDYPVMSTGNTLIVGDFYKNPSVRKALFMFDFDANQRAVIFPSYQIAGKSGVVKNHSFCSFLSEYGFKCNIGVMTAGIVNLFSTSYTVSDLRDARDRFGAFPISHTHAHVQQGDVAGFTAQGSPNLGPVGFAVRGAVSFTAASTNEVVTAANDDSAILLDFDKANQYLIKWGFSKGAEHLMLSQGGFDFYTNSAIEKLGFKTVRGVHSAASYNMIWPYGSCISGGTAGTQNFNRNSTLQLDGSALSDAQITDYFDMVIKTGGIGSFYTHSFGTSTVAGNIKRVCELLQTYIDAGLCRCVTCEDL